MNHNDDIITVNFSQAGSHNNDLMYYVTQLKQSGIIVDLISENYVEPSSWNSLVVFTMNPDDLYKIPDIVDQQIIMDVITDDNNNFTTKEIAVIVYNNYITITKLRRCITSLSPVFLLVALSLNGHGYAEPWNTLRIKHS